jgi:hypothetical protein
MKALLINPETRQIDTVEIAGIDDIRRLIGFDTLESDAVGDSGDRLFFDEECFIRGSDGRFQIDSLIPVAGKGLVVAADGAEGPFSDVRITAEALAARTKFQ